MSQSITRQNFDEWMIPVYAPAAFIPVRAEGSTLWDQEGKEYIDFAGGIAVNALGHAHPKLREALETQAAKIWHTGNGYTNEPVLRLAKRLIDATFADRVFFCNSGAEANEAALKLARKYAHDHYGAQKSGIVAFKNAFHGRTLFTVSAGGQPAYSQDFAPLPPQISHAVFNDLDSAAALINDDTCAVIVEPVQGEGGVVPATKAFLQGLRELCDRHNALLIFDEVQTGVGRTGHLYAYMHYGVTPEMLDGVKARHDAFVEQLNAMNQRLGLFKEIRGLGLLIGCVLKDEYAGKAKAISLAAAKEGAMVLIAGANVLRFAPALNISHQEIETGLARMARACENWLKEGAS
ncbi:aminotransferase class III-fold pyridoxal phosphate-dependent enzyme [Cronobacter sakazakii]|uniref:Aspartate aminotransferase family protein n=1 Tax=Cronobacter sakazakii TaxID=28141 RepID=A0AA45C0Z4_CROSK|nr:aminotransferase class III-fold pyridoxal phosphate-dependent enzyme [Cronobacter sakazakii]PUW04768.1 aspartate aminotransferase family protein [Cronobacter sakazakii]